jgi:hypothetical protein
MAVVTVTRVELVLAKRAGAAQVVSSSTPAATGCPHRITSSDADERMGAAAWIRGYTKGCSRDDH